MKKNVHTNRIQQLTKYSRKSVIYDMNCVYNNVRNKVNLHTL